MPIIIMRSEEFGEEEFEYATLKEAREGFIRLKETADAAKDGVQREILLILDRYVSDEDEQENNGEEQGNDD